MTHLWPASPAESQDINHCLDDLTEQEIDHRIDVIQGYLDDGQKAAASWRFGWMTFLAGSTALPAYNLVSRDTPRAERFFEWSLIGASAFEVLRLSVVPMPDVWGGKRLRKRKAKTLEQKREKLKYATRTLERAANVQHFFQGNTAGGSVIFGIVMGSVYAGRFHEENGNLPKRNQRVLAKLRAAGLFLIPSLLGIAEAITVPLGAKQGLEKYRGIACSGKYYDKSSGPEFDLDLGVMDVRLSVSF